MTDREQTMLECRDFIADLIGGAKFEGRAIEHAKELPPSRNALKQENKDEGR